ncbi:hypothetical protein CAPTEDRAFT_205900 [Capitella teleta]|uniref:Uncharacterized protein n=1 Tax=Capitella teleta TaxID=283909 RepID=R7V5E7_CAPTE|nr:hypothetical protein CAPTEDRAFT_205900 [Capitella teleta]|eukprot:ELU14088.1 hypothetical protein CAPTEDRAFT_205900 [Capitella teleta]
MDEEQKCEKLKKQEDHLLQVHEERTALYQQMCNQAKATCKAEGIDSFQPGPIFFLVPRKTGLFGVCCKGLPRQVNFLIDEAHLISKGSNAVVSFLHHFFERAEQKQVCPVVPRVESGLHKSITQLFGGGTKFAPDWCFGLVKQAFKRHVVNSISCLAAVVNGSASCNQAAVVETEDGHNNISVMDWQRHFAGIGRDFHGIKQYQHFLFDWQHPGVVFFKRRISDEEGSFQLFKETALPTTAAAAITPPGLSRERQAYLFEKIRPLWRMNLKTFFYLNICPVRLKVERIRLLIVF